MDPRYFCFPRSSPCCTKAYCRTAYKRACCRMACWLCPAIQITMTARHTPRKMTIGLPEKNFSNIYRVPDLHKYIVAGFGTIHHYILFSVCPHTYKYNKAHHDEYQRPQQLIKRTNSTAYDQRDPKNNRRAMIAHRASIMHKHTSPVKMFVDFGILCHEKHLSGSSSDTIAKTAPRAMFSSVYVRFLYIHRHVGWNAYNSIFYN